VPPYRRNEKGQNLHESLTRRFVDEKIGKVKKKEPAEKVAKPLGPVPAHTQAPKAPKEIKKKETTNAIESAEQFSPI